jgi:hypothetical protein
MDYKIIIPDTVMEDIREKSNDTKLNKRTGDTDPKRAQIVGKMGEYVLHHYLRYKWIENTYTGNKSFAHDFIIGRATIDVKAKYRNVDARPNYTGDVQAYTVDEIGCGAGYYVYASANLKTNATQLMGWLRRTEVKDMSDRINEGDMHEGKVALCDVYKTQYQRTHTMEAFFDSMVLHLYQEAWKE